jgi:hypothetical protein
LGGKSTDGGVQGTVERHGDLLSVADHGGCD